MRIWLDDIRPEPTGWVRCYWPSEVIALLEKHPVSQISLDHDLGDDSRGTGYDVLKWIEEQVFVHGRKPPRIDIHTANPAAKERMKHAKHAIYQHYLHRKF